MRLTLHTHFPVLSSGNGDNEPVTSHLPEILILPYTHLIIIFKTYLPCLQ